MSITDGEMGVVKATVLQTLQPIAEQFREICAEVASLKQRMDDEEIAKAERQDRRNLWLKVLIPICTAVLLAFGAWIWNQHAATVELRASVGRNADAVAELAKTVGGINQRSNSQAESFTALKGSVDAMLEKHTTLMSKVAQVDWEAQALQSSMGKRRRR